MAYLEMFSPERLALQEELAHPAHQELWPLIAKHPPQEFELRIAEISAYLEVALDGYYTQAELNKLCDILTRKLYERRTGLVITTQ